LDKNDKESIDIDAITDPKDPLSRQLLGLVSSDATIEDTLYYLEKALGKANITTDVFLKTYRNLATDQFVKKALIKKIHQQQKSGK